MDDTTTGHATSETTDATGDTAGDTAVDGLLLDELLVEEISIDGMCGVY
jgi:mycofactocin precursor